MKRTLGELAELVSGEVRGDRTRTVQQVRTLSEATEDDLSFLSQARYLDDALASRAGALLARAEAADKLPQDLILVENPSLALSQVLSHFAPQSKHAPGVDASAVVADSASVHPSAAVGPFCVIGSGSEIGAGASIDAHVVIGEQCRVGPDCRLYSNVVLYDRSVLGSRCILHAGVIIGGDGFGYATAKGEHHKLEHLGRAVLGDDVEVGANSTIDRAVLGDTKIGDGTKIDNLVMVAHSVEVGRGCLLVAQAGLAGSARLGDGVVVAGQSGIIGHVKIGDGVVVATKSAVLGPVEEGRHVAGIPATDLADWRRQQAVIRRLPDLRSRLLRLERAADERLADERLAGEEE